MSTPRYRNAYVVEPGYDFSPLLEVADKIVYVTSSFEKGVGQMRQAIEASLAGFDPELDIVVPVGKVLAVFLTADYLAKHRNLRIAVYDQRHYEVMNIHHWSLRHKKPTKGTD